MNEGYPNSTVVVTNLNYEQRKIIEAVSEGSSVFMSGAAGTGKTHLLREIIRMMPEDTTFVSAMTGMASSLLPRGRTLHWFCGYSDFVAGAPRCEYNDRIRQKPWVMDRIKRCRFLILDEVSMLSREMFDELNETWKRVRKDIRPFGGIQL
jgi:ATP-dependent DNA helicase PIF1